MHGRKYDCGKGNRGRLPVSGGCNLRRLPLLLAPGGRSEPPPPLSHWTAWRSRRRASVATLLEALLTRRGTEVRCRKHDIVWVVLCVEMGCDWGCSIAAVLLYALGHWCTGTAAALLFCWYMYCCTAALPCYCGCTTGSAVLLRCCVPFGSCCGAPVCLHLPVVQSVCPCRQWIPFLWARRRLAPAAPPDDSRLLALLRRSRSLLSCSHWMFDRALSLSRSALRSSLCCCLAPP